jgi:3-oxoacyl-[acyl-carrier protein] reductase
MEDPVLLSDKIAVVYGGGGAIGAAVARAFAREGAKVFLAGRTRESLDRVAEEITASGGVAESAQLDALDESSVDDHADAIAEKAGGIDVSFNAVGRGDIHGTPVVDMQFDDFVGPVMVALRSQFLTARAAARHMAKRESGVILAITATTARMAIPEVGGTGVAFDAHESICRQLACELGPKGIRVAWLLTTGLTEALHHPEGPFPDYGTGTGGMSGSELVAWMQDKTMLNRLTTLKEVGDAAAFLASDLASAMTGSGINLTCGSIPG